MTRHQPPTVQYEGICKAAMITSAAMEKNEPPKHIAGLKTSRPVHSNSGLQAVRELQFAESLLGGAVYVLAVAGHLVAEKHIVQLIGLWHRLEHALGWLLCQRLVACRAMHRTV